MSLLVFRKEGNSVMALSDTRITDPGEICDSTFGALKLTIINPKLLLGFAGKTYYADIAIKSLLKTETGNAETILSSMGQINSGNINPTLDRLMQVHCQSKGETEFSVVFLQNNIPVMFKISNGCIEEKNHTMWIGNKDAFNCYQRNLHKDSTTTGQSREAIYSAFGDVMKDHTISTVGDFMISAGTTSKLVKRNLVFEYKMTTEYIQGRSVTLPLAKGEYRPIPRGGAAEGAYTISYLTSISPEKHGVAIYFEEGQFGVLYCPQISPKPKKIKRMNVEKFMDQIKKYYDLPLEGMIGYGNGFKYITTK